MGLVIVIVVGAILGWLASVAVEPDNRVSLEACLVAGIAGGLIASLLDGNVPLSIGIGPTQLVWTVLGAALAIVGINLVLANKPKKTSRKI